MSNMSTGSRIHTPQLEDIPELIHPIPSLLPAKEAAHAHASCLRHGYMLGLPSLPSNSGHLNFRNLQLHIHNQESAIAAEKWIQPILSKSCLKELSLKIRGLTYSLTMPNELFSSKNLSTINVTTDKVTCPLRICSNPFIKCVTLRVLDLKYVNVTEEVVHNLLSTCTLLEKIKLWCCEGLKNVTVKNLRHLRELVIISSVLLEIKDVPNPRLFDYDLLFSVQVNAPKLLYFYYDGRVHGLLFPTIAPKDINLHYFLRRPFGSSLLSDTDGSTQFLQRVLYSYRRTESRSAIEH
ncbi:F-box protein-like protein [Tanacetum coccineum]